MYHTRMASTIFAHLNTIDPGGFIDLDDLDAHALLSAQAHTTDAFLQRMGGDIEIAPHEAALARQTFNTLTDVTSSDMQKKQALSGLRVPQAVRHLAGMLSEYDWDYVQQAKEIRGYVAAKLLEESKNHDARVRLRALQLLGTLTEVGSFTERIEVTKKDASSQELVDKLRSKLAGLLPKVVEVQTVEPKPTSE